MSVVLRIGAREWDGWQTVDVTASIEQAARSFKVSAAARGATQSEPLRIRPGSACQILVDGEPLLTGFVDSRTESRNATTHEISVDGRSKTADLIDCSAVHDSKQFKAKRAHEILHELCDYYSVKGGVEWPADEPMIPVIPLFAFDAGDTVFDIADRLARMHGMLLTDDALGRLLLTTAGIRKTETALVMGRNLLSLSVSLDASKLYKTYQCLGQRAGTDDDYGIGCAEVVGDASDAGVLRNRTLIVHADGNATTDACNKRARWEAASRAGQAIRITAVVQGWRQYLDGPLWEPNYLVDCIDADLGVNGTFLIAECAYHLGDDGTTCTMQLAPKTAYDREPPKEQKRSGRKSARAGVAVMGDEATYDEVDSDE